MRGDLSAVPALIAVGTENSRNTTVDGRLSGRGQVAIKHIIATAGSRTVLVYQHLHAVQAHLPDIA